MLTIVGIGPGEPGGMTLEAYQCLERCDCIVGYHVYADLVRVIFPDKEYYTTPMTQEVERCLWAIEQADAGREVALVCSGDSGVYGMAGLVCELAGDRTALEILPGVTAACSGAAVLGAPLAHDFAVISLSDRLTPWEQIERRLAAAAAGDFVICLYNPASKGRPDHLRRACDILLASGMEEDRICGVVHNIGRGRTKPSGDDFSRAAGIRGGYVYHGVYRQPYDQTNWRTDGDVQGLSEGARWQM